MIALQEAVDQARSCLHSMFGEAELSDLALESARLDQDRSHWQVTFSHARQLNGMEGFGGIQRRCYRRIQVDSQSGEITALERIEGSETE